jgi:hypothetical protein
MTEKKFSTTSPISLRGYIKQKSSSFYLTTSCVSKAVVFYFVLFSILSTAVNSSFCSYTTLGSAAISKNAY